MSQERFNGIKQYDGTNAEFSEDNLERGYINFIRTEDNKSNGYINLNGKNYGKFEDHIDCGVY